MVQTILSDFSVNQHIQAEHECKNTKNSRNLREFGAGNGARTRHLRLGKAALYQLSYSRINSVFIISKYIIKVNTSLIIFFYIFLFFYLTFIYVLC